MSRIAFTWHDLEIHQIVGDGPCTLCGKDTPITHWLSMYEDKVFEYVPHDDEEFAWMPVCEICYAPYWRIGAQLHLFPGQDWFLRQYGGDVPQEE